MYSQELLKNPQMPRRDFLKAGGLFGASAFLPGLKLENFNLNVEPLYDLGLGEYTGILARSAAIRELFGLNPGFFPDVTNTLQKVSEGTITKYTDPAAIALREGWDEATPSETMRDAKNHLDEFSYDVSHDPDGIANAPFTQYFMENFLKQFPVFVLAMPTQIDFYACYKGLAAKDFEEIQSPWNNRTAPFILMHEDVHEVDIYRYRIQKYINQSDYIKYVDEYLYQTYRFIVYEWLMRPQHQVLQYLNGVPIVGEWNQAEGTTPDDTNNVRQQILTMQDELKLSAVPRGKAGDSLNMPGVVPDERIRVVNDWNVLIHEAGNYLFRLPADKRAVFLHDHIQTMARLFYNGIFSEVQKGIGVGHEFHLEGLITEVMHHFVDPVIDDWQLEQWRHPLIQATLAIQEQRLNLYSWLPRHSSVWNLRKAFWMDWGVKINTEDPFAGPKLPEPPL